MQLIADDKYLACNWKKGIKLNNYNSTFGGEEDSDLVLTILNDHG